MISAPRDYRIPDDPEEPSGMDGAFLRTLLGIRPDPDTGDYPEFPDSVRAAYYEMSRSLQLLGARGNGMSPTELATVATLSKIIDGGAIVPAVEDDPLGLDVEQGQKVVARYRNKDRPGHFRRFSGDKVVVVIEGEDRNIDPQNVRLPKEGEFDRVPSFMTLA